MAKSNVSSWLLLAVVPALLNMASSSPVAVAEQEEKVDPAFLDNLETSGGTAKIVILFAAGTKAALDEVKSQTFANREERLTAVNTALTQNAAKSQASVVAFLAEKGIEYDSKWINNSIFIQSADAQLIRDLAAFPEVGSIREDNIVAKIFPAVEQPTAHQ